VIVVSCVNLLVKPAQPMQKHWLIYNWIKTRHTWVGVRGRRCLATADLVVHYVNLKMLSHDTK